MSNGDLINALGRIDDDLLDRAARYREKGGESHEQVRNARQPLYRRIGLIAACLVILLCAIPISRQVMNGFAPIGTGDETTGGCVNPVNPDFVIENGVLLSYVGDNPHVIIPDEVREISRDAFAEKGDVIETIYVGKNVETVDSLFLSEVKHLASIEVAEENERFEIYEGVFVDKDNTIYIDAVNGYRYQASAEGFMSIMMRMERQEFNLGETVNLVIGEVSVVASSEKQEDGSLYVKIDRISFRDTAFEASIEVDSIHVGSGMLKIFQNGDSALFCNTVYGAGSFLCSMGEYYLLTEDGVIDLSAPTVYEHYNDSMYFYNMTDDGMMEYMRLPYKFFYLFSLEELAEGLRYITGFDEFYKETGYITVEKGMVVYHPTATYTVETAGMKDRYVEAFESVKGRGYYMFDTIEELFEYNKTIRESAK